MNSILKKIKNRIKDTKAMSIGETLVATLILLLATSVLVTTISLGASHYVESLSGSEANILASTLESIMTNELAYTKEIHVSGNGEVTSFLSQNYADTENSTIFVSDDGKIVIGDPDSSSGGLKLLADSSYPHNLEVDGGSFKITYTYPTDPSSDASDYYFTVQFKIVRNGTELLSRTFNVLNVNRTEAVS